jgi:hypothetical protein
MMGSEDLELDSVGLGYIDQAIVKYHIVDY